jgi:uncharacterized protein (DUF302 family)
METNMIQEKVADVFYIVESGKTVEEIVDEIGKKAAENGFRVLYIHDVQMTLKEKGYDLPPYKIVELCNAKFAHAVLEADRNFGLMLPCKINVYVKDGKSYVVGLLPTAIREMFPDAMLGSIPEDVEKIIKKIIDEVK